MSDNVISFPDRARLPEPTSELRKAVLESVFKATGPGRPDELSIEDTFLAHLWVLGFMVSEVPAANSLCIAGMDVIVDPSVPEGMILVTDQRAKEIVTAMVFSTPQAQP